MEHFIGKLLINPSKGTAIRYLCTGVKDNQLECIAVSFNGSIMIEVHAPQYFDKEQVYIATAEAIDLELPVIRAEYNQALAEIQAHVEKLNAIIPAPEVAVDPAPAEGAPDA